MLMKTNEVKKCQLTKITVLGNIGSGKSSLLDTLSLYGFPVEHEPFLNEDFLSKFYENMKENSYLFQLQVLNSICKRNKNVGNKDIKFDSHVPFIVERGPEDGLNVFAVVLHNQGFIKKDQLEALQELYNYLDPECMSDNFIYLRCSPETCLKRIKIRERECEKNITLEYLTNIHNQYELLVNNIHSDKVLIIDAEQSIDEYLNQVFQYVN